MKFAVYRENKFLDWACVCLNGVLAAFNNFQLYHLVFTEKGQSVYKFHYHVHQGGKCITISFRLGIEQVLIKHALDVDRESIMVSVGILKGPAGDQSQVSVECALG